MSQDTSAAVTGQAVAEISAPLAVESQTKDASLANQGEGQIVESLEKTTTETEYPHGLKLVAIVVSLYLAMFLVALVGIPFGL